MSRKEKNIKAIILEPDQVARVEVIENSLSNLQRIVGGRIECLRMDGHDIIINEEGKYLDLEPNFVIQNGNDYVAGTAIFVGVDYDEGEFKSLSDDLVKFVTDVFKGREKYYRDR
jgi:hypothetical protein